MAEGKFMKNGKEVEIVNDIDMSKVDPDDRPYIKKIFYGILNFDDIMPKLVSDINATPETYNITLKGWILPIDIDKWHKSFLNESTRSSTYDSVVSCQWVPAHGLIMLKIRRSNFSKLKKKNK